MKQRSRAPICPPKCPRFALTEQTEAARIAGVTDIHWLGFPDGRVEPDLALRRAIARVIRIVRPQRVLAQNPVRSWDRIYGSHPDHLAVGEATLRAVFDGVRTADLGGVARTEEFTDAVLERLPS